MSSNRTNAASANRLLTSPKFDRITGVAIKIDDKTTLSAGNATGRVITYDNPFATQALADNILQQIAGYRYQPYSAERVFLDPAAELGDGLSIDSTYGGISRLEATYGHSYAVNVSAPDERAIDSEIPVRTKTQRRIDRNLAGMGAAIGGFGSRLDKAEEEFGSATKLFEAQFGDVSSNLQLYAQKLEESQTAISALTSRLTTAEASISLKASRDELSKLSSAHAALIARVGKSEAKIEASVKELANSVQRFVDIEADLVNLKTKLTISEGAIVTEKLWAKDALMVGLGGMTLSGPLNYQGKKYTPKSITSTDGTAYSVLAQ